MTTSNPGDRENYKLKEVVTQLEEIIRDIKSQM